MTEAIKKTRKQFTNIPITQLMNYRLPAAGMVSIFHRISGFMMFLLLPFILYLFDQSITSEISFAHLQGYVSHWLVKLFILALSWAYLHHFCAGIRHLIMDMGIGETLEGGKLGSQIVLAVSAVVIVLAGVWIW